MKLPSWESRKDLYEQLTLSKDGDPLEREGALMYGLGIEWFTKFLEFWRRHVAPATHRPYNQQWREHAHATVAFVGQHNYSVFFHLFSAFHFHALAQPEGPAERQRRLYFTSLIHAGNAIEVVDELLIAVATLVRECCNPVKSKTLLDRLNPLGFIGKEEGKKHDAWMWNKGSSLYETRRRLLGFRNFLSHEGIPNTEYRTRDGKEEPLIEWEKDESGALKFKRNDWARSHAHFVRKPEEFKPLSKWSRDIIEETARWLDEVYGNVLEPMNTLVGEDEYRKRWGWQHVLGPNCNIDKDILSGKVILCCGEDCVDLLRSFEKGGRNALRQHTFRCYRFWKYTDCTLIWTGIGTGCLEPLLGEIILRLNRKEIQKIALIGTAAKIGKGIEVGKVYQISKAHLFHTALDHFADSAALCPNMGADGLPEATCISTDLFYFNDLQAVEKHAAEKNADLIDMEVAQFYYLCTKFDKNLKFVAVKGAANELSNGEQQLLSGPPVIDACVKAIKKLFSLGKE